MTTTFTQNDNFVAFCIFGVDACCGKITNKNYGDIAWMFLRRLFMQDCSADFGLSLSNRTSCRNLFMENTGCFSYCVPVEWNDLLVLQTHLHLGSGPDERLVSAHHSTFVIQTEKVVYRIMYSVKIVHRSEII